MISLHTAFLLLGAWAVAGGSLRIQDQQKTLLWSDYSSQSVPDGEQVHKALLEANIIPQVIQDFTPGFLLSAQWPGGRKHQATLGNDIEAGPWIETHPTITFTPIMNAKAMDQTTNFTYAIALTDPDAPSPQDPERSEFCHWVATGRVLVSPKPPQDPAQRPTLQLASLESLVPFRPPSPPPRTGPHRYIFIAFAHARPESDLLNISTPKRTWGREGGVKAWARENSLNPIAANFLYVHNEEQ